MPRLSGGLADDEAHGYAVQGIDDQLVAGHQLRGIVRIDADRQSFQADFAVNGLQRRPGRLHLGNPQVLLCAEKLTVQVRLGEHVGIGEAQLPDSRPGEDLKDVAAKSPAAGDEHPGRTQAILVFPAEGVLIRLIAFFIGHEGFIPEDPPG
jgi:hypothetical protein